LTRTPVVAHSRAAHFLKALSAVPVVPFYAALDSCNNWENTLPT
jgi:hypothetical protein